MYGENAASEGQAAFEAHLAEDYRGLAGQPSDGTVVGDEVSPYGPSLRVRYPRLDVDAAMAAARAAMPAWRDAGALTRAAVCLEIVDAINKRSFEIANAVMHTSGQPFVMSFQAGGPHAQDRAVEAIVGALVEQERVPASVVWEKPAKGEPVRMQKDYRIVPRGVALVIGCNTFPTWNSYPGLFASLATGNAVVVKPHPHAILPLAISVEAARTVLEASGFDPALVQLAPEADGEQLARTLAERPEVAIIDYTGGPGFGGWLEREAAAAGKQVYTEKSGVNSIVLDSTDNLRGVLGNLAFSLSLYSGQMCTTPQNLYVPRDGIDTDEGHLSFEEVGDTAGRCAHPVQRRRRQGGRDPRRDGQRRRAQPGRLAARAGREGRRHRRPRQPHGSPTRPTPTRSCAPPAWSRSTWRRTRPTRWSASARCRSSSPRTARRSRCR